MNYSVKNLNRIEFVITFACTGRCRHCSEGDHPSCGRHIDGELGARAVYRLCNHYKIESLMTFGGEPLLYPDDVCRIHSAAKEMNIPQRQIITNGFFSKSAERIKSVARMLAESGVNDLLLSVDAFHQETIPLEPVMLFAKAIKANGIPIRTQPAWLVNSAHANRYNLCTREILEAFEKIGISANDGNEIFPGGNALKYLRDYFDFSKVYTSPYTEDPADLRAISIEPDGSVLGGNLSQTDILDILESYKP